MMPNAGIAIKYVMSVTMKIPMKSNATPFLAMCEMVTHPEPKIMALGGVATGSMKAHDAEIVAGIINKNGCTLMAKAVAAKMGIKMVAIAVFELTSVKNVSIKHVIIIMIINGTLENILKC